MSPGPGGVSGSEQHSDLEGSKKLILALARASSASGLLP